MIDRPGFQVAAWALAGVIVVFAALRILGPGSGGGTAPVRIEDGSAASPDRRTAARRRIYVHVAGAVRRPGLYRVPAGGRAAVAVARAGGFVRGADAAAVNLAARLHDGEQVVVPRGGAAGSAAGVGTGKPKVTLAVATVEQLDSLDGIGPTLARRIVEYRDTHGGLRSLEQLREVDGIGEKRFAALKQALSP